MCGNVDLHRSTRIEYYPNPWSSKNPWGVSSCNTHTREQVYRYCIWNILYK